MVNVDSSQIDGLLYFTHAMALYQSRHSFSCRPHTAFVTCKQIVKRIKIWSIYLICAAIDVTTNLLNTSVPALFQLIILILLHIRDLIQALSTHHTVSARALENTPHSMHRTCITGFCACCISLRMATLYEL